MKEKKKIPLKRFLALLCLCEMFLMFSSVGTADEEASLSQSEQPEETVQAEEPADLPAVGFPEDSLVPSVLETETKADPDAPLDALFPEEVPSPQEPETETPATDAVLFDEPHSTQVVFPVEAPLEDESEEESEETPVAEESETESESRVRRAGSGTYELPVDQLTGFLVTWTNSAGETIYRNNKGEVSGSLEEISGTYTLKVEIICAEDCTALTLGCSYTFPLDWPAGEGVSVNLSEHHGEIVYTDEENKKEVYIGSWTIGEDGLLTLAIDDNEEAARTDRWEGYFAVQAFVSSAYDEPAGNAAIGKESHYDPASQRITWTITADIPAYAGAGACSSWTIEDETTVALGTVLNNDMADVRVLVESGGFTGEVPAVENASPGSPIAYALEDLGRSKERLYFLTPCTCSDQNCQNYKDGCANVAGTGPGGEAWCSCWDIRYNSSFTITYSVDVVPVLKELENNSSLDVYTLVVNQVTLYKNKALNQGALAMEQLNKIITKEEIRLPDRGNDYTASYQITVNPKGEDYGSADVLSVTDSMKNLSLLTGSLAVTTGGGISLEQRSEEQIAALPRQGNEDRYFSLEVSDVTDDGEGMPAQTLLIQIWYPTSQTYNITYDAMVVDPELGRDGSYGNEAILGEVSVSTEGRGYWAAGEWEGMSHAVTLEKVDADAGELMLPGAKFEVWQFTRDGDDLLITTLTTGEDGRAVFQSDRRAGYCVQPNTLYYLIETEAPPGYLGAEDKIWFYLRKAGTAGIPAEEMPAELLDESGSLREDVNFHMEEMPESGYGNLVLELENEREEPEGAVLPETGGHGEIPEKASAILLIFTAFALLSSGRKKYLKNGEALK